MRVTRFAVTSRKSPVDRAKLERIQTQYPGRRFIIFNGYCPWAYGVPMNPTVISTSEAQELLNQVVEGSKEELIENVISNGPPPVQYAEKGDRLYEKTGGNRFISLHNPDHCVRESST